MMKKKKKKNKKMKKRNKIVLINKIITMICLNENGDNVISPYLYKELIKEEDLKRLKPLFCTKSLEETRIICSHMRPSCVMKEIQDKYGFEKQEIDETIIDKLKGLKVGFLRRPLDENGNKIDGRLIIEEGVIEDISEYWTICSAGVKINNIDVNMNRVFLI